MGTSLLHYSPFGYAQYMSGDFSSTASASGLADIPPPYHIHYSLILIDALHMESNCEDRQ